MDGTPSFFHSNRREARMLEVILIWIVCLSLVTVPVGVKIFFRRRLYRQERGERNHYRLRKELMGVFGPQFFRDLQEEKEERRRDAA